MSALTQSLDLLPPLLVSVGGIISLLLESSPFSPADKKIRKFISALYFITVWLAYFVSRLLGKYVFYSPIFTLVTFLLGFIFFIIVLYMALNKSKMKSKIAPKLSDFLKMSSILLKITGFFLCV